MARAVAVRGGVATVNDGASLTVSVKSWTASGETPFEAVMVMGYVPPVPMAAVPDSVAVPLPLSVKVTPDGSAPDAATDGTGNPLVLMLKSRASPTRNVAALELVIPGDANGTDSRSSVP